MKDKKAIEKRIQELRQPAFAKEATARLQAGEAQFGDVEIVQKDYGRAMQKGEAARIVGDHISELSTTETTPVAFSALTKAGNTGAKQHKGARKGHEAVHGTKEEKQARWDAMQAEVNTLHEQHSDWSWEDLKRQAAKNLEARGISKGLGGKSFNRNCINPRKPKS